MQRRFAAVLVLSCCCTALQHAAAAQCCSSSADTVPSGRKSCVIAHFVITHYNQPTTFNHSTTQPDKCHMTCHKSLINAAGQLLQIATTTDSQLCLHNMSAGPLDLNQLINSSSRFTYTSSAPHMSNLNNCTSRLHPCTHTPPQH
jgi:hypothetical protein